MLLGELPSARLVDAESILEWRLNPARLDGELASFVSEAYLADVAAPAGRAS